MEGEGSAQSSEKQGSSIKPRLSKKLMVVIVVCIAAIVILAVVLVNANLLGGTGSDEGGDMFKDPHVGDYIVYDSSMSILTMTTTIEVVFVNATHVTILQNTSFGEMGSVPVYQTISKEEAFRSGKYDPYKVAPGSTVENMGKKLISTPYGARNCDHFLISNTSQGQGFTTDVYIYKGILVEVEMTSGPTTFPVLTLLETNLDVIIHG
jgi:hypothetical protein